MSNPVAVLNERWLSFAVSPMEPVGVESRRERIRHGSRCASAAESCPIRITEAAGFVCTNAGGTSHISWQTWEKSPWAARSTVLTTQEITNPATAGGPTRTPTPTIAAQLDCCNTAAITKD